MPDTPAPVAHTVPHEIDEIIHASMGRDFERRADLGNWTALDERTAIIRWLRNPAGKGSEEGADWADSFADRISEGVHCCHPIAAAEGDLLGEALDVIRSVIARRFDHFTARNGRRCSIEGDDGEKCWIIPYDEMALLEGILSRAGKLKGAGK